MPPRTRAKLVRMSIDRALLVRLLALAPLALAAACGDAPGPARPASAPPPAAERASEAPDAQQPAPGAPSKAPAARGPIDPATAGTLRGVVRFDGTPPPRKEMAIGNSAGCEHHPVPPLTEDLIVADGLVENVFVHVKKGLEKVEVPPAPAEPVVLDQRGCMYRPRVVGMRAGQKLAVRNSDGATHNVHSRPERNDGFNRTQAPGGADVEWVAAEPEVMIPFGCDIHPWMKAWVGVVDHPFFAVTGPDGGFTIPGLPPGEFEVEARHEKLGKKTGKIVVSAGGTAEIVLTLPGK